MHFFIDENISPRIANALNHLAKLCSESHTVLHAREVNGGPGMPDEVWLEQLKQSDKTWVILSKDRFQKGALSRLAGSAGVLTHPAHYSLWPDPLYVGFQTAFSFHDQ